VARTPLPRRTALNRFEAHSSSGFWLRLLVGGSLPDSQYVAIGSVQDAIILILTLANYCRGRATPGLYRTRNLIDAYAASSGVTAAGSNDQCKFDEALCSTARTNWPQ
jgi:hypothetical protein